MSRVELKFFPPSSSLKLSNKSRLLTRHACLCALAAYEPLGKHFYLMDGDMYWLMLPGGGGGPPPEKLLNTPKIKTQK